LESDEFDKMLDSCHESKASLYNSAVTDQQRPRKELLKKNIEAIEEEDEEFL
jgi:dsDNA-binding SOS-regulon protein